MLDDLHLEVVRLVILRGVLRTVSLSRRREPRRERLENARARATPPRASETEKRASARQTLLLLLLLIRKP